MTEKTVHYEFSKYSPAVTYVQELLLVNFKMEAASPRTVWYEKEKYVIFWGKKITAVMRPK